MIQVIYRWEVSEDRQPAFLAAWEKTTLTIRETTAGARGSLCVTSVDRPVTVFRIAHTTCALSPYVDG